MDWKQVKKFNPEKMGSRAGYCLQNTRLGFGIAVKYPSAKAEMEAQKKAGTFHSNMSEIPTNCSVPVFVDTPSIYEHVMVYHKGTIYSDGKKVKGILADFRCFGWGETLAGVRVIEKKAAAQSVDKFLHERGYWLEGDNDIRVGKLSAFMRQVFPSYTNGRAISNAYNSYLVEAIKEFQRRTKIKVDGSVGTETLSKLRSFGFKA